MSKAYKKSDLFSRCREQAKLLLVHGISTVRGINVDGLPQHGFAHRKKEETLPLEVLCAGWGKWKAGCFRFREFSDTFSLELVTDGEFVFEEKNERFSGVPGTLFFVRRRMSGGMLCLSANARKRTVILSGEMLDAILENLHLAEVPFLRLPEPEKIGALFARIEKSLRDGKSGAETSALAFQLLMEIAREVPRGASEKMPALLREIFDRAERDIADFPTLEEWAKMLHVSVSTLHRLFRQHCHASFAGEMLRRKMTAAQRFLLTTEMPIKEIASTLGFANRFYFSSVFRKYSGMPPGRFRKSGADMQKKL